ncbi:hypothetical protein A1O1_01422 [Capronia coronata CBS 617.96]|uniref:Dipeptidyl-peptidase V n=1 Tax=Capronia coronata CBS 617.96 TaxID=1182541 RepID=W9Z3X9_9EURO|nr:uncharacterized protein A1O1_01422 [Capronia coronata CBS 617.96]EXJ96296.1 hypothetical protein A1O1_01422 [Capronia coronata CBS 617.96]
MDCDAPTHDGNGYSLSPATDLLAEKQDLTQTEDWNRVEGWFQKLHAPGFGRPSDADELSASPDGKQIAFTSTTRLSLEKTRRRIHLIDLGDGNTGQKQYALRAVTQGPNEDKKPKWSPDNRRLAFLSDRRRKGHFQLYALDVGGLVGEAYPLASSILDGVVEDFEWSPDGTSLLLRLAAWGLPKSGFEGSGTLAPSDESSPAWMPTVKHGTPGSHLRTLWLLDVASQKARQVSQAGRNVWRFTWAGKRHAFALVSDGPSEGEYKYSSVVRMSLEDGSETTLRQHEGMLLGELASPFSGAKVAFPEAEGGDRSKVAGPLVCIDVATQQKTALPSQNVDVHALTWLDEDKVLIMGLRGLDSVMVEVDVTSKQARELWSTPDTCGSSFPTMCLVPGRGIAVVRHGWKLAPEIGLIDGQFTYHPIHSFDHPGSIWLREQFGPSETITWKSTDGVEIQGFLYRPAQGSAPFPTILNVHGGPFSAFSSSWMGYRPWVAFLVAHGYAVFSPNPRGSVGRGSKFAAGVKGDLGGGDARDLLSGVDHLVGKGLADPRRLGVIGGSYGGYMTAWLTTITTRFSAAIPISPVTDWRLHWQSSDLHQDILDDGLYRRDSLFETRSPLQHVHKVKTPTLQLVGTQDSCTPPAQAHYYHVALTHHGVRSAIVEYPLEGHGIRHFPALIDACVRMLSWFGTFVTKAE